MSEDKLLSVSECAEQLKVSAQLVRNWIKKDELRAEKVGKQFAIRESEITNFLKTSGFSVEPDDHPCLKDGKEPITALSFFSGALGLDIGFKKGGIQPRLLCEFDKNCRLTINRNEPSPALIGNIWNYTSDEILEYAGVDKGGVDVMLGGPPCQAFSTAGNRRGFLDARGNVFLRYVELIQQIKPRYFVIENVRGLLSAAYPITEEIASLAGCKSSGDTAIKGGALFHALTLLRGDGYKVTFELYNAANFGAAQIRERVVIIGTLSDTPVPHLTPTHSDDPSFGLPPWVTFGEIIKGLPKEQHALPIPEKRLKYYKLIGEGGNWKSLPVDLQKEALGKSFYLGGGKTGFLRRLSFSKPAPTLVTHPLMPATDLAHPVEDRALSIEEYKRIQGFPDDWTLCGNLIEQYKQVGNAVPVALGEAVAKAIVAHNEGSQPTAYKGFRYSRYRGTDEASWEKEFLARLEKL